MHLTAFRTEYQITVEPARNRIFYKHYAELASASELPDYLSDWQYALKAMQPGFTILSDMTNLPSVSAHLTELIEQVQQLVIRQGVRLVAAVYPLGSETYYASEVMRKESGLPMRAFMDLWEADKFLDELTAEVTI